MYHTAYITFRDNKNTETNLYCSTCDGIVGKRIYYYDRDEKHYTAVCKKCVDNLKKDAQEHGFMIEEKEAENRSYYAETALVAKKLLKEKQCSECNKNMTDYMFDYKRGNKLYKKLCLTCIENILYDARLKGYKITYEYKNDKFESCSYSSVSEEKPVEHNTSFFVVCSKCFAHTFLLKSWS